MMTLRSAIARIVAQEDLNFLLTNRLPRRLATRFMGRFSKIEQPAVRAASIALWRFFADVDLSDAAHTSFRSLHEGLAEANNKLAEAEQMKAQAAMASAQSKAELGQADMQRKMAELQQKGFNDQQKAQEANQKLELQLAQAQNDAQMAQERQQAEIDHLRAQTAEILASIGLDERKQNLSEYTAASNEQARVVDQEMAARGQAVDNEFRERGEDRSDRQQDFSERTAEQGQ